MESQENLRRFSCPKSWKRLETCTCFYHFPKYNLTRQQHRCSHGHKLNDVHCINNQQLEISCKHFQLDICLFHPLVWFQCLHSGLSYFTSVSIRNKPVNWRELLVLTITVDWMPEKGPKWLSINRQILLTDCLYSLVRHKQSFTLHQQQSPTHSVGPFFCKPLNWRIYSFLIHHEVQTLLTPFKSVSSSS